MNDLINSDQASQLLGVSASWFRARVKAGEIPVTSWGRSQRGVTMPLFRPEDVTNLKPSAKYKDSVHRGRNLTPKNGRYINAVLVGGDKGFFWRYRETAAQYGVYLSRFIGNNEDRAHQAGVSEKVDVILILGGFSGHGIIDSWVALAKREGLRFFRGKRLSGLLASIRGALATPLAPVRLDVRGRIILPEGGEDTAEEAEAPGEENGKSEEKKETNGTHFDTEASLVFEAPVSETTSITVKGGQKVSTAVGQILGYTGIIQTLMRDAGKGSILITPDDVEIGS